MRSILFLTILFVACISAQPAQGQPSPDSKCLNQEIASFDGKFMPSPDRQRLIVARRPFVATKKTGSGYSRVLICQYQVSVGNWDTISKSFIYSSVWEGDGPGLLFTDGYWHQQLSQKHVDVEPVHLVPGALSQVLVRYRDELADGGSSQIRVVAFTSAVGNYVDLLNVEVHGFLDYCVEPGKLVLTGNYYRPGACWACGEKRTVGLHFDREARSLAIDNPSREAVEFFKSIELDPRSSN